MAETTPLEARLSYRCSMIATRIARFLAPMWEERYGLSVEGWRILAVIGRHAPVSAKDLAVRSSSDAYHISRAIERLRRSKLIRRRIDPKDGRRVRLELTAAGRAAHETIVHALSRVESELLAGLRPRQREPIVRALTVLDERASTLMASGRTWKEFLFAITPLVRPLDAVGMTDCGTNPPLSSPDPAADEHDAERTKRKFLSLASPEFRKFVNITLSRTSRFGALHGAFCCFIHVTPQSPSGLKQRS